jgi:hypothetical protein
MDMELLHPSPIVFPILIIWQIQYELMDVLAFAFLWIVRDAMEVYIVKKIEDDRLMATDP